MPAKRCVTPSHLLLLLLCATATAQAASQALGQWWPHKDEDNLLPWQTVTAFALRGERPFIEHRDPDESEMRNVLLRNTPTVQISAWST